MWETTTYDVWRTLPPPLRLAIIAARLGVVTSTPIAILGLAARGITDVHSPNTLTPEGLRMHREAVSSPHYMVSIIINESVEEAFRLAAEFCVGEAVVALHGGGEVRVPPHMCRRVIALWDATS